MAQEQGNNDKTLAAGGSAQERPEEAWSSDRAAVVEASEGLLTQASGAEAPSSSPAKQDPWSRAGTPPSSPRSPRVEGFQEGGMVGGYIILRKLGQGGMGTVYEAEHATLGKRVAIKTLLPDLATDADTRARFIREGQAASRVRHPNVVDVYDVGEQDSIPYLVMEYLEGESLRVPLSRNERLSLEETCDIVIPVLAALAVAHDQGVVHRDLKPDNVFLCASRRGHIEPKIVDFGISKVLSGTNSGQSILTGTAAVLGTPYYMSPEQAQNAKGIDGRSDQYSAAVMTYEAVTGHRPFQEESLFKLMTEIVSGKRVPPTKYVPDLPEGFCDAVLRAMSPSPSARFPTVRDFALGLLPYASDRIAALYGPELRESTPPGTLLTPGKAILLKTPMHRSLSSVRGRPRRRHLMLLGLGLLALVVAVVLMLSRGQAPSIPAVTLSASGTPSSQAASASAPAQGSSLGAASAQPRVLRSTPSGAEVYRDGHKLGTTPLRLSFSTPDERYMLELRVPGHQSSQTEVKASDSGDLSIELKPARKASPKPTVPSLAPR